MYIPVGAMGEGRETFYQGREMEASSIREAVCIIIDRLPVGAEFSGNNLKKDVTRLYPPARYCYADSALRKMRGSRRKQIVCLSRIRSLYKKVCK